LQKENSRLISNKSFHWSADSPPRPVKLAVMSFNEGINKMKKALFFIFFLIVFAAFMAMGGYRLIGSGIARLTSDFNVLPSNNRILYEEGAETLAKEAAKYLPQTITTVESRQFGSFRRPVAVYVFATSKSFSKFSGVSEDVIGAGLKDEVYLSGKLLNMMDKTRGILTHELSHAQLSQTLGAIQFNRTLPRWFREGLAIYVADGGGATNASEEESIDNFLEGKHFIPELKGELLNMNLSATAELHPKIFYRQSGMFVQFLAQNQPAQLEKLLRGLQEGKAFKDQFIESFENDVDEVLQDFIVTLKRT
jgi:hypothetical protein